MITIIHYHEIALKGKNRPFFEKALCNNVSKMFESAGLTAKVQRISGRIIVRDIQVLPKSGVRPSQIRSVSRNILSRTFGIKNFSFGIETRADVKDIKSHSLEFFTPPGGLAEQEKPYPKSFKIQAQRSEKHYPFTSKDLENEIGAFIKAKTKIPVDLEKPKKTLFVEIAENKAFLHSEKIPGPGGLPYATAGKVVSLLSSGLDSPVAAHYLMKRGGKIIFLHFHASPYTPQSSEESVKEIVKTLGQYSPDKLKLILTPFGEIQKYVVPRIPPKFRVVFYRRIMLKIASRICENEGALGIVTGDSLGQVASQTLENIRAASDAAEFPIFRPLIGFDKEEIIELAKKIGTYEISASAGADCCTLFMPKFPATKSRLEDIKYLEKNLGDLNKLIKKAIKETEIIEI